jgi:hypothetical protein
VDGAAAGGRLTLRAGGWVCFALHHARTWEVPPRVWSQDEITRWLDDTVAGWRSWSAMHQGYEGPWRELVHHSGRVLQALTFAPTRGDRGGPDHLAARDGRRRAQLGLPLHLGQGCQPHDLQIMFGVGGERDLAERELPHLRGWRGSRPVRVGNGAWNQRQLDVYGELLGATSCTPS